MQSLLVKIARRGVWHDEAVSERLCVAQNHY